MRLSAIGLLVILALGTFWLPLAAAPRKQVPTIGVLTADPPPSEPDWKQRSGFLQELRTLGWQEGENITVEYRWAAGSGEGSTDLAAELVGLHVDVIVASSASLVRAAQRATTTIPIVMLTVDDPVDWGFIAGWARPGGNITGVDASLVLRFIIDAQVMLPPPAS
jgi:putative tryptophan/tyrosine transport system substrate-binding protein